MRCLEILRIFYLLNREQKNRPDFRNFPMVLNYHSPDVTTMLIMTVNKRLINSEKLFGKGGFKMNGKLQVTIQ